MAALGLVDGIGLEEAHAVGPGEVDRGGQQAVLDAPAAELLRDVGAHHRPHLLVVDGLHHRRAAQLQVVLARAEADPAGGAAVDVAHQARLDPGLDEVAELGLVVDAGLRADRHLAGAPVVHAPAAPDDRAARQGEEGLQVRPGPGGQGTCLEVHVSIMRHSSAGREVRPLRLAPRRPMRLARRPSP